jgi:hypothetical protein
MEGYDSLAKLYRLYATLSQDATLATFSFILDWPELEPEQKRTNYSKHACHELNFFLSRKDPQFFNVVVKPYLRQKKDKTFMDHYLLGDDLSRYVDVWNYRRLNIVERALLGRAVAGERDQTARHVRDLYHLLPPNQTRWNRLFDTALKAAVLSAEADELSVRDTADDVIMTNGSIGTRSYSGKAPATDAAPAPAGPTPRAAPTVETPAAMPEAKGAPQRGDELAKVREARKPAAGERERMKMESRLRRRNLEKAEAEALQDGGYYHADKKNRRSVRQLYRKLEQTKEWVENNYYHLPIEQQDEDLITTNAFWADFANHDGDGPFVSANAAEAGRNFAEMMLALSVTDLPFKPGEHKTAEDGRSFSFTAASPVLVYHKQIGQARAAGVETPILISQNVFRRDDRYQHVDNRRRDKFVTEEFLPHVVYGCQVVLTNPTSSPEKLDLLLQIPRGSMPLMGGRETHTITVDVDPFSTRRFEYYFYFPTVGKYAHYPVHVSREGELIANAQPFTFNVVAKLSNIDKTSWAWVSQNGTAEQVMQFLRDENVHRLELSKIAWRMADKRFFNRVMEVLVRRHAYDATLFTYGLKHNHTAVAREYLKHRDDFLRGCGDLIRSKLITIDPVVRKWYQHMEYEPLVNARAHQLGGRRKIVNPRMYQQYHRLLKVLSYRGELDNDDLMAVTYYLLLQDRVDEGLSFLARVDRDRLDTQLQYDYFAAYAAFCREQPGEARKIAARYADHGVDRWRKRFDNVIAQADEIEGKAAKAPDADDRE